MKKYLIVGLVLITICLGLTIYHEFIDAPININDITNTGSKSENRRVYLNATFVAGKIVGENNTGFYVMFGDGVQYIVNISHQKANEINKYLLDNPEDSYRIEGVTKLIADGIIDDGKAFVKTWLDTNHNHHDEEVPEDHTHDITTDDFYHYFGYVYLDTTHNSYLIEIIIYITGIVGTIFILSYVNTKYHLL